MMDTTPPQSGTSTAHAADQPSVLRTDPKAHPSGPRAIVGAVVGLSIVLCLMLLAFATPAIHSGADDLPLGVAGPQAGVTQLTAALDKNSPGAFEVKTYDTAAQVTEAIRNRDLIGGIVLGAGGVSIQVASAAGTPYAPLLRTIGAALASSGQTVTVTDVVPLTPEDPAGAGLSALGLPLVFGGLISAVALTVLARRSPTQRIVGAVAFSVLAGLAVTATLQYWLGTLDGPYWMTSATVALGIGAVSLAVLGLESLWGYAGYAVGALTMLFIANPLSGMATGAAWLPTPWGTIGQLLPIGAAGTAIRSVAFFGGAGATTALIVLGVWTLCGLALVALSAYGSRRRVTVPS